MKFNLMYTWVDDCFVVCVAEPVELDGFNKQGSLLFEKHFSSLRLTFPVYINEHLKTEFH